MNGDMKAQEVITKLFCLEFAQFCQESGINLAILFGSRALGRARDDSDFDIAILMDNNLLTKEPLTRGEVKRLIIKKITSFLASSRVDLVILNQASHLLKYQVLQTGKLLYESEQGGYARYASLIIRQHSDGRLFREIEKAYLIREGNPHG